jgi:hypothetical protein
MKMLTSGAVVSTLKELIFNVTELPAGSVTVTVQFGLSPSLKEFKVIVVFPLLADVVTDEQAPPYVMVPALSEENV